MDFQNITKQVLDGHGYSQEQLAKLIGVTQVRISQIVLQGGGLKYDAGQKLMSLYGSIPNRDKGKTGQVAVETA